MLTRVRHWFACQRLRRELDALTKRMDHLEARLNQLELE